MLHYKQLLEVCIKALNCFNYELQSVEEHIKTFLKQQKGLDDDDHVFIVEVFSGCSQYAKLLNVVVEGFYITDGKTSLKTDHNLYTVLCYMAMFRLNELGISNFKRFVNSQDVNKMHRFLNFFFDDRNLMTWIHSQWCTHYDSLFVEQEIMENLQRYKPQLDEIVIHLKDKIDNKTAARPSQKELTRPKSFNLTKPKPRSIPLPMKIPTVKKHQPVPEYLFGEPRELQEFERIHEENRQRGQDKLFDANTNQLRCANPEKSFKTKTIIKKIIEDEENKLEFNKKHMKSIPKHITKNRPIKMNTTAILREGAHFQKKEKQELEKLEKLLAGAKDASEFLGWQRSMLEKDKEAEEAGAEYRRVEGKISHEEAILARQNQAKANQEMVSQLKFETAKMMQDFLQLRLAEEKQMRQLVEDILGGHSNAKEAKVKLQEYKRKIVAEVNAESRELMRGALQEAEEEMMRKTQLIKQIRAMESIPIVRHKLVDTTSTAGHSLLSEMSVAELNERLCLLRESKRREEEEKRDSILREKQLKNESLLETLACISTHRNELSRASHLKEEENRRVAKQREEALQEDGRLRRLQGRLEEKREERRRRSEEAKVRPDVESARRTKGLIREKKDLEKKRWQQLEVRQNKMAEIRARTAGPGQRPSLKST